MGFHFVTVTQPAWRFEACTHSSWCTGENHIAWFERHGLRKVCDLGVAIKNQMAGIATLAQLAIDAAFDVQRQRPGYSICGGDPGAEWGVSVEELAHRELRGS